MNPDDEELNDIDKKDAGSVRPPSTSQPEFLRREK
jgi:hypothetical protein